MIVYTYKAPSGYVNVVVRLTKTEVACFSDGVVQVESTLAAGLIVRDRRPGDDALVYRVHEQPDGTGRLTINRCFIGFGVVDYTSRPIALEPAREPGRLLAPPVVVEQLTVHPHPTRHKRPKAIPSKKDAVKTQRPRSQPPSPAAAPVPLLDYSAPPAALSHTAVSLHEALPAAPDWAAVRAAVDALNRALTADPALDLTLADRRLRVVYG